MLRQKVKTIGIGFLVKAILGLFVILFHCTDVSAQSSEIESEFWPQVDAHIQLGSNLKFLTFGEYKNQEGFPYQQLDIGLGLGYQFKRIEKPHQPSIDPDREYYLVFGGGYEHLDTLQSGKSKDE